jgi:hypothetical protein
MSTDLPLFDYARRMNASATPRALARTDPEKRLAADLSQDAIAVLALVKTLIGPEQGMTAAAIAEALDIHPDRPRERRGDYVRRLLNSHKADADFVIIADPANGFYRPASADDITHFDLAIHSRIREMWYNLRSVRRKARMEGYVRTGRNTWTAPHTRVSPPRTTK